MQIFIEEAKKAIREIDRYRNYQSIKNLVPIVEIERMIAVRE
jgi:hypothetical protein